MRIRDWRLLGLIGLCTAQPNSRRQTFFPSSPSETFYERVWDDDGATSRNQSVDWTKVRGSGRAARGPTRSTQKLFPVSIFLNFHLVLWFPSVFFHWAKFVCSAWLKIASRRRDCGPLWLKKIILFQDVYFKLFLPPFFFFVSGSLCSLASICTWKGNKTCLFFFSVNVFFFFLQNFLNLGRYDYTGFFFCQVLVYVYSS